MKRCLLFPICLLGAGLVLSAVALAQQPASLSSLQTVLNQSAESGKFTLIVFHRDNGATTGALLQQAKAGTTTRSEVATVTSVRVDDPAERALVEKFGISRAPMPMAVMVAPNGAVTGLFTRTLSSEQIAGALVPPTMMRCMKELQDQKLVFVCLSRTDQADVPAGVEAVRTYPQFKDRISVVGMRLDDPAESRLYEQMQLKPQQVNGPYAVLIAPPGVLIGHYDARATGEQIAAAIHKAGQCCDDPNCKHNHPPQATRPGTSPR